MEDAQQGHDEPSQFGTITSDFNDFNDFNSDYRDGEDEEEPRGKKGRTAKAEERRNAIMALLKDHLRNKEPFDAVFQASDGHTYAHLANVDGRPETLEVSGKDSPFARWLIRTVYNNLGYVLGATERDNLISLVIAQAEANPMRDVALRLAGDMDTIYIDLADAEGRVIVVKPSGWSVVSPRHSFSEPKPDSYAVRQIPFVRPATMLPLPEPHKHTPPETLKRLFDLMPGVSSAHRPLLVFWLLGALKPGGPYPVLSIQGPHGVGKSVTMDMVQGLIDPTTADRRNLSSRGDARGVFMAARVGHIAAYDNVSGTFSADLSDALAQVSTGGTFATRAHYTNDSEHLVKVKRPVIISGIDSVVTRQDLLSRTLLIELSPIANRRPEAEVKAQFEDLRADVLGALLDALVAALAAHARGDVVGDLPRMADVAAFVLPAEAALGLRPGDLRAALERGAQDNADAALDASPLARAVLRVLSEGKPEGFYPEGKDARWLKKHTLMATLEVWGSKLAAEAERMDKTLPSSAAWPHGSNALKSQLRRNTELLARHGVTMSEKHTKDARYTILALDASDGDSSMQATETPQDEVPF